MTGKQDRSDPLLQTEERKEVGKDVKGVVGWEWDDVMARTRTNDCSAR